jgi:trimeric autotransporter adhesin
MNKQLLIPMNFRLIFSLSLAFIMLSIFGACFSYKSDTITVKKIRHASVSKSVSVDKEEEEEKREKKGKKGNDKYDGAGEAAAFEVLRTKDPATGTVPSFRLMEAMEIALRQKGSQLNTRSTHSPLVWSERGPYTDVVGVSNGNTRANSGITAGRIRAVWVDKNDATGKTVWVGGVDGGLWKTIDITSATPNWQVINDFFSNLAVTSICQDPTNSQIMYFSTGEAFFNADAVQGVGVFKSTDGGATWSLLPNTSSYVYCTKILCDASGNVYLGTRNGFQRSTDGGSTWVNITPTGLNVRIADFEISSTGRLHLSCGLFSTTGYAFTDVPSTVTPATWTSATTPFPNGTVRCELACLGNTLYAVSSTPSSPAPAYAITQVHKSIDGGANWTTTNLTATNTSDFGTGQAWYNIWV